MAIKKFKPTTPSLRTTRLLKSDEITRTGYERSLTKGKSSKAGRGAGGRISVRRRGGGVKRKYREIDFKRDKFGVPGTVAHIEYDPNRSANIALIHYKDGEKRYIVSPKLLKVGDDIVSGKERVEIKVGNAMPLGEIPLGRIVHNVELVPGKGAQLARSAGASAQLVAIDNNYATLILPSGETRMIHVKCFATIGSVGNEESLNVSLGKAGRSRWLGRRPKVRGVVMNPVDHPHGGGEGKTSGGRHPVSPWGMPTKGYKTRDKKKPSSRFIIAKKKGRR